ncbi:MAG: DUF2752 domain-containing protein [Nocardioidaceae bacterium]
MVASRTQVPTSSPTAPGWSRASLLRQPLATAAVLAGAVTLLRFHDPHQSGSYGYCPLKYLTGINCPGCGGLRAVNDLAHGQWVAAASSNLLLVVAVPVVAGLWLRWMVRRSRGQDAAMATLGPRALKMLVTVALLFMVVRNLPFGAWLAP